MIVSEQGSTTRSWRAWHRGLGQRAARGPVTKRSVVLVDDHVLKMVLRLLDSHSTRFHSTRPARMLSFENSAAKPGAFGLQAYSPHQTDRLPSSSCRWAMRSCSQSSPSEEASTM